MKGREKAITVQKMFALITCFIYLLGLHDIRKTCDNCVEWCSGRLTCDKYKNTEGWCLFAFGLLPTETPESDSTMQTLKKINIPSPATWFHQQKKLQLINWQWTNSVAKQYSFLITGPESISIPPKNIFFPSNYQVDFLLRSWQFLDILCRVILCLIMWISLLFHF